MAPRLTPAPYRAPKPPPPRQWLWLAPGLYGGVLARGVAGAEAYPLLAPYLDQISEAYDTPAGIMAIFDTPCELDPETTGALLPLRKTADGGWSSYPDAPETGTGQLACYLDGAHAVFERQVWRAIDLTSFWDMDDVEITRAAPLPVIAAPPFAPPQMATRDPSLTKVLDSAPPLATERDRVESIKVRSEHPVVKGLKQLPVLAGRLGFTVATLAVIWVLLLIFLGVVGVLLMLTGYTVNRASNGESWILSAMLAAGGTYVLIKILSALDTRVIRPGRAGTGRAGTGQHGQQGHANTRQTQYAPPRTPGWFSKARGWLIWNTPAGNQLRRGIEKRLAEMDDLLNKGKIDEALKRAFSMAESEEKQGGPMSSRLPDIRSQLGLDFGQKQNSARIPFGSNAHNDLRNRYRQLAKDCEAKGDYGRAAFIYDELLGAVVEAIRVLEHVERYEDAAKLAMARNLPGGVIVRLWYLAGERDVAIALAVRHSSFGALIREAEHKSKDAALFIRRIWAEKLAEVGDYSQALLVSDKVPDLADTRSRWLTIAITEGQIETPDILHRALTTLPWREDVLTDGVVVDQDSVSGQLETQIMKIIDPGAPVSPRIEVLGFLSGLHGAKRKQTGFLATTRAAALSDLLIRQVLADGVPLTRATLNDLGNVARSTGLNMLATDLRNVRRKNPEPDQVPAMVTLKLTEPRDDQPRWKHVVCLPNDRTLLCDDFGTIRIITQNGALEWGDHVTDLAGFVRIRTGRFVLLILGGPTQPRRIMMLDTIKHQYTSIGSVPLDGWHKVANEQIWMVKSNNRIQALAIGALFQDTPELSESWGVTITEDVHLLGFIHNENIVAWYIQRREPNGGFGLIEYWNAQVTTLAFATYFAVPTPSVLAPGFDVYSNPNGLLDSPYALAGENAGKLNRVGLRRYSWKDERDLEKEHARFLSSLTKPAPMRVYGSGPLVLDELGSDGPDAEIHVHLKEPVAKAELVRANWVASDAAHDGSRWVVVDSAGRAIQFQQKTGKLSQLT